MLAVMAGRNCYVISAVVRDKIRGTLWMPHRKIFFAVYYLLLIRMFLNVNFKFRLL
jgi:hypothetical protein